MRRARLKKNRRQRKCLNCKDIYTPDPGNRWHQEYCSKPACRSASKHAAQKRWLASEKGRGYFQDALNVKRVQQWREEQDPQVRYKISYRQILLKINRISII
jgi:hypothetical protein